LLVLARRLMRAGLKLFILLAKMINFTTKRLTINANTTSRKRRLRILTSSNTIMVQTVRVLRIRTQYIGSIFSLHQLKMTNDEAQQLPEHTIVRAKYCTPYLFGSKVLQLTARIILYIIIMRRLTQKTCMLHHEMFCSLIFV
jgi:hypothetical protein